MVQPLALQSIQKASYHDGSTMQQCIDASQFYDLAGKPFVALQVFAPSSDAGAAVQARVYFANAADDSGFDFGQLLLSPTAIISNTGASQLSNGQLNIPKEPSGGPMHAVFTWSDLPYRFVKFELIGLSQSAGYRLMSHIYAR